MASRAQSTIPSTSDATPREDVANRGQKSQKNYTALTIIASVALILTGIAGGLALGGVPAMNPLAGVGTWLPYLMISLGVVGVSGMMGLITLRVYKNKNREMTQKADLKNLSYLNVLEFDFVRGCTQYHIPRDRNDAQDCSFIAAYSILYIRNHLAQYLDAIKNNDINAIKKMHLEILEEGYKVSHPNGKKIIAHQAMNPNQLQQFTKAFTELKIPETGKEVLSFVSTEFTFEPKNQDQIRKETSANLAEFFEGSKNDETLSYLLVVVDGQTFSLTRLNTQFALLFDSHRSCFQVVDTSATISHIFQTILAGNGLNNGEILFYPGQISI